MKYRNVLAGAALVGMMAITGCSSGAYPENNEGNRNGERLVESVTRNADGYEGNRTRGFTRGFTRNANNRSERRNITRNSQTTRNINGLNRSNTHTNRAYNRANNRNNTRGLAPAAHTFEYETNRNHRYLGNDITMDTNAYEQTVPVIAMEDNEEANATRVANFFSARRNRNAETPAPITPEAPQAPTTLPAPVPNTDNNNTETPDVTPLPQPINKGTSNRRAMK